MVTRDRRANELLQSARRCCSRCWPWAEVDEAGPSDRAGTVSEWATSRTRAADSAAESRSERPGRDLCRRVPQKAHAMDTDTSIGTQYLVRDDGYFHPGGSPAAMGWHVMLPPI